MFSIFSVVILLGRNVIDIVSTKHITMEIKAFRKSFNIAFYAWDALTMNKLKTQLVHCVARANNRDRMRAQTNWPSRRGTCCTDKNGKECLNCIFPCSCLSLIAIISRFLWWRNSCCFTFMFTFTCAVIEWKVCLRNLFNSRSNWINFFSAIHP